MFLVPKPGTNKWRLIIDLRELNKWCKTFTMSYETLKHLRHLARAGDWFVSMDLADGYYALGIREEDRDFFTVNYRGELWRLACLPMGWTGSSYYFCKLTAAFTDYLRTLLKRRDPALPPTAPSKPTRRFLRNTRWRGARLLPYMDDFLFLADSREAALELRVRLSTLLDRLGLLRNPNKGVWEPTQVGPGLQYISYVVLRTTPEVGARTKACRPAPALRPEGSILEHMHSLLCARLNRLAHPPTLNHLFALGDTQAKPVVLVLAFDVSELTFFGKQCLLGFI
eukprot:jgi/Tetstr1/447782/TSEL_035112.t1